MSGTNLTTLRGVGAAKATKLGAAGFQDVESLAGAELDALITGGFSEKAAAALIATAVDAVGTPTPSSDGAEGDSSESGHAKVHDTAPRHIHADGGRATMGASFRVIKKSKKDDDDTHRKTEFRRRWEDGTNPSTMEEFRWVKEFLG